MNAILITVFVIGYLLIILEGKIRLNKAAMALLSGGLCWLLYAFLSPDRSEVNASFMEHIGPIASILLFLMGAMTMVEIIDDFDGFVLLQRVITSRNKKKFLFVITLFSFFLSAVLDNLTTAIVISTLVIKLVPDDQERKWILGMVVIAANAGGVWSPIGDVTTTMLWTGKQVSTIPLVKFLFLPSLVSVIISYLIIVRKLKGQFPSLPAMALKTGVGSDVMLLSGLFFLLLVPVLAAWSTLAPCVVMLFCMSLLWVVGSIIRKKQAPHEEGTVLKALERIDLPTILFFFGILISIAVLESAGLLEQAAHQLSGRIPNQHVLLGGIGLISSVLDNVPLVAALQAMYPIQHIPADSFFWHLLAYTSGTGGSLLIIGSAAGVVIMGPGKISFGWYLKNISLAAFLGYLGGFCCYLLFN
ncbi:MAG TPA: sodium:proton antiporter NhaD [Chitinophagaceae bacterium]|nr:sodium:proton antiporter NhaD [Chitinophagaceae bacterium]